ncbi:MAG: glucosamine-6-phosphate deaminase [Clostridiales bacterium GWF2_38_85]|nr:MAG: glucosamine-6-phosphate deaminase [Clostridiales bacterium GWF2_38_85]HBL83579.1 glucosamine-6-phosphate deaminase [Clostridiales bacterium]
MILKSGKADLLEYKIYDTRENMGRSSADEAAAYIKELLIKKNEINMIFAAAPSQNEFLATLVKSDVNFSRINAFHMDEYIGLDTNAPQGFGNFLNNAIFSKIQLKSVNYIDSTATDPDAECKRYSELLEKHPIDIVCMGIGENGHIAFNDPGTGMANFNDKYLVKKVVLDDVCRQQQVNDGCFKSINEVPKYAITLTVPMLFSGDRIFCVVPATTKANAVKATLIGDISENCPASILRRHKNSTLYGDKDSGKLIL